MGRGRGATADDRQARAQRRARLRRLASRRQSRGAAELSVVLVAASLVAGVLFGNGVSRTAVELADGLTWLGDDPRGEVIQVNPALGRTEVRRDVATPGNDLTVEQHGSFLYVIDNTDGVLSTIDVATLDQAGRRSVPVAGAAETLTDGTTVFLVDRVAHTVAAIDPLTADPVGRVWTEREGLADVAVDDQGTLWSLDRAGHLTALRWSTTTESFLEQDAHEVGARGDAVVIGHEVGVTVMAADPGVVEQVGSDDALRRTTDALTDPLLAPVSSPADLTAVSSPAASRVVVLAQRRVAEVSVAAAGCEEPGRPAVFGGLVYVPCAGAARVLRLDASGAMAAPPIATPRGEDPELVLDDDTLLINVPGADDGIAVGADGSTTSFSRDGGRTAVRDPQDVEVPDETVDPPPPTPTRQPEVRGSRDTEEAGPEGGPDGGRAGGGRDGGRDGGGRTDDDPDNTTTSTPTPLPTPTTPTPTPTPVRGATPSRPADVTATVVGSTQVRVDWTYDGDTPDELTVSEDGGAVLATAGPGARSAVVVVPAGTTTAFVVTARIGTRTATSSASAPVTTEAEPVLGTPTSVRAAVVSSTQVQVDWAYTGDLPDEIVVATAGGVQVGRVGGAQRQAVVTVAAGEQVSFLVTARLGGESSTSTASNSVTPAGVPGRAPGVSAAGVFGGTWQAPTYTVAVSWDAAPANGSPITGYRVTVSTGTRSETVTLGAGARSHTLTSSCDRTANASCSPGGGGSASVTPINGEGTGPQANASASDSGSIPVEPLPGGGVDHVSGSSMQWGGPPYEGFGTLRIALSPPADWRAFGGTCTWTASGGGIRSGSGSIGCGATSLDIPVNHGIVRSSDGGTVTHYYSVTFHASNAGGSVSSARHDGTYTGGSLCRTCPIP